VLDNILIALRDGRLGMLLTPVANDADRRLAEDLLAFVGYTGPMARLAGELPHVDKRLVELARALATRPKVLLLDEPAAGLTRDDKSMLAGLLRQIAETGIAVILVEHDMSLVMEISDHVVVLDAGRLLMAGTPREVRDNPAVHRAYLGGTEFEGRPRAEPWAGERVAVLTTVKLTAGYGAAPALEEVSLTVNPGEMVAVLGANGAGKSTLLRAISGLHRPIDGSVLLNDEEIKDQAAYRIVERGLSLVPEGRQVFPELTARDNVLLGAFRRSDNVTAEELDALLERFPRLKQRLESKAGVLSGGEQQMLALARGLISKPKILLLDEPSLGLAPAMIGELYELLARLRDEGVTILIVDQMANLTLTVADRGYVLNNGRIAHAGSAKDLKKDPAIERAYLGGAG
jgi:branched-chain amino acid transport system permease protein